VFNVLVSAGAGPAGSEGLAGTGGAGAFGIVVEVGVFAGAFEVLGAVYRDVNVVEAFTVDLFAFDFIVRAVDEVVIFVGVIAETFRGRAYYFAGDSIWVIPSGIHPVLSNLCIIFLVVCELFLAHHHTSVLTN
jgi:hypothetical protein